MSFKSRLHCLPSEDVEIERSRRHLKKVVDLRGQHLSSVPPGLFKHCHLLVRLETLDLSFNNLRELPRCIDTLRNLRHLHVHHNSLRRLPAEVSRLKQLQTLDVSHNRITTIPHCLCDLENLQEVNFSGNHVKHLDEGMFRSPVLQMFAVTRNPIRNVPRDVYVHGLRAIRRHFGIQIEKPVRFHSRQVLEELPIPEQVRTLQLRHKSNLVDTCYRHDSEPDVSDENDEEVAAINKGVSKHKQIAGVVLLDRKLSTSDYGSCSGSNIESDLIQRVSDCDGLSCHGDCGSDNEEFGFDLCEEEDRCEICMRPLSTDYIDLSDMTPYDCILPNRSRLLKVCNVTVVIPEHNKMNYMRNEFTLDIISDSSFRPDEDPIIVQASPVVLLGPHGAVFYEDKPAVIRLPLFTKITFPTQVHCLRSNTDDLQRPFWERIPSSDFRVREGYILLKTSHFSLFTAVLNKTPFSVNRTITSHEGGVLEVNEIPGLQVKFPRGCVHGEVEASIKVLCSELPPEVRTNINVTDALATPAVILQPHGYLFNALPDNPVTVRLPLPDYSAIIQNFGFEAELSVWHSPTTEDQPVAWEALNTNFKIVCDENGNHFIDIQVLHFSWLTALWASIRGKMQNARLGVGFAYSGGAVNMKCQACMLENPDTGKFGLVVICHNSEDPMQDVGNYAKNVGGSLKPVSIGPGGSIIVKLGKSDYFEADTAAGEDETLEQIEENYKGGEFEKQFACKFKGQPSNKDIFGKVFVRRRWENGTEDRLFEFNLIKKTDEPASSPEDPWTAASLKQLAEMHGITDGDNWKQFARALGFSLQDLRTKFGRSSDIFAAIIAEYRRQGGTHSDFLKTLNEVGRDLRVGDSEAQPQQQQTTPASSWMEMISLGWLTGATTTASSITTTPSTSRGYNEEQAGPSGLNLTSPRRKRVCSTCETETSTNTHSAAKRLRYGTATSMSPSTAVSSEAILLESLRISPEPKLPTPPRSPGTSVLGTLPTFSRYSPPLGTMTNRHSHVAVVQSHTGNVMSAHTSGPVPNQFYNTPLTETRYGSIPSSSSQSMPEMRLRVDEDLMRGNTEEITQPQLYRIAPIIQPHWLKVARYIREDETLEADLRAIRENHTGPEEQAVQMLLQWRDKCPDICTRGKLYSALCDLNLRNIAKKCTQVYNRR
ncbi:uncharacterized protein LOC117292985 [Asterias rubens]|uniref:uncharacterized protein LOC117292985 n=1 Tax=Asterias rubens TaxID=7604 RepID=UPI001455AC30|nr:uncharacterized protein LOC117292985 [Asterias rubens]